MRVSRWLGGSTTVVIALVAAVAGTVAVADGATVARTVRSDTATSAEDPVSAQTAAKRSGRRVEISGLRTETTQVFANPSGTFTSEQSALPVRVRRSGTWVPVDTTLTVGKDGMVRPAAAPTDVAFSNGGNGPLVRMSRGDKELALGWPAQLPTPVLAGDTATYTNMLPETDLQLRATRDGFAQVLIVKSRAAATNPALGRIRLTTQTKGLKLTVDAEGATTAVDSTDAVVFAAGTPTMWDSTDAVSASQQDTAKSLGGAQRSTAWAPGAAAHRSAMRVHASAGELVVEPDRAKLTAPDARYPYYIDPSWAGGPTAWTMINSTYPNQSYWAYDRTDCPGGVQCAKVGYTNVPTGMVYRSLFQFPVTNWRGTHVLRSTFSIDLLHSWSCSNTATDLWLSSAALGSGTTWANNASTWGLWLSTAWTQSCNDTRKRVEFGGGNLPSATQQATGWAIMTVGLREVDEAHVEPWKKFDAGTALLSIEYNSYPYKPDQLTVDNKPCTTGANRPYVTTKTPTLRARLSDPDAGQLLNGGFSWAPLGTPLSRDHFGGQDNVANGSTLTVGVPGGQLADGGTYYTQAGVGDYIDLGPASDICEFTVDATPPDVPTAVSSPDYPADGAIHGGIGKAGTFTITPPATRQDDVAGYVYALTPATQPTAGVLVPAKADKSATFPIVPTIDGVNMLRVWARDRAGNLSDIVHPLEYRFSAGEGAPPVGQWSFTEGSGTTVADSAGSHPLTLSGGTWTNGRPGGAIGLANASGHTNGKVLTTNAGFSVAAWVRLTDTGQWRTAVSQDGTHASGFFLQYSKDANAWAFSLPGSDADNPPLARAVSTSPAQVGVWTHLTGVYDDAAKQVRLYVNGALAATTNVPAGTFDALGDLVVGRAKWNSVMTDPWSGDVDEVRVWQRVVGEREIAGAARPQPPLLRFPNGAQAAVGKPVEVSLAPAGDADIVAYRYSVDGTTPSITVRPVIPGGSVTVAVVPGDVDAVLQAVAIDQAGNQSLVATSYELDVSTGSGPPSTAHADLNNDGRSDVPIVYDNGNNETEVWNLTSTPDGFNTPTVAWTTGPGGGYPVARLKTVTGDIDGDGRTDIAMFRDEGGGRSTLSVLRGDGNTYKLYPTVWDSGPCACSSLGSAKLVAGDFTGDGKTDLAQLYDLGNATWEIRVWVSKGLIAGQPAFEAPTVWLKANPGTSDWNEIKIVAGDVNGDGKADIAEFYNYPDGQTKLWMHYSQRVAPSGAFAFTDAILAWDSGVGNWWWTSSTVVCGDFTGDGKADIGIVYNYGNDVWRLWTLTGSSGGVDGPFQVGSPIGSSDAGQMKLIAGDFTGDGRADVGHLYNYGNAQTKLWTLASTGGGFGAETLRWDSGPGVLDWNRATPL